MGMREAIQLLTVGLNSETITELQQLGSDVANSQLYIESAMSASNAIDILNRTSIDCVVSESVLPDQSGVELLSTIRDSQPNLPFILYTDTGNEHVASEAISAGVSDYIPAEPQSSSELLDSILQAVKQYRKRSARRHRDQQYQAIFNDPNLLVGILDTDGTLLEANRTAGEYIDSDVEEVTGEPFWETQWWDERTGELIQERIERAAKGEYVEYEADLTDDSGEKYNVTGAIRPVTDQSGQVISLVVSALDITEGKRRERRLQKERQFIRGFLDALPDVFYAFGADGYLLRWNNRLETVTGYSEEEIKEMHVTEFVPDEEVDKIARQFQTVTSEQKPVTVESAFETKDGESLPYEFTGGPIKTEEGGVRGLIGIGRDISDRMRRQRRFEAVFNNTYQFTGLMDPDGTVVEANQAALSFGNIQRSDIIGEKLWDAYWFQKSETARQTAMDAVEQARGGDLFRDQLEVQGAERDVVIDFSVRPVTDNQGNVTLLIPEGRDITRLYEREQQLQVTNRVLRHNIRNQLNLIRGTAASLEPDDAEAVNSARELIVEAADHLLETTELTRQLNQLVEDEPETEQIDLVKHVNDAVASVKKNYPAARIEVELPETAPAEGLEEIQTAIEELLENAVTHNPDESPEVHVSVTVGDSTTEVAVTDNAGGIPDVEREILAGTINIGPLAHGRGIGLWYIQRAVHYSNGSIDVFPHTSGSKIQITLQHEQEAGLDVS